MEPAASFSSLTASLVQYILRHLASRSRAGRPASVSSAPRPSCRWRRLWPTT